MVMIALYPHKIKLFQMGIVGYAPGKFEVRAMGFNETGIDFVVFFFGYESLLQQRFRDRNARAIISFLLEISRCQFHCDPPLITVENIASVRAKTLNLAWVTG